jgi:hypothetical protein
VHQGLFQRFVTVFVLDVFAHDADGYLVARVVAALHQALPASQFGLFGFDVEIFQRQLVHSLLGEVQGHLIDRSHVFGGDHRPLLEIAEERDLALDLVGEEAIGAAQQNVGLDADGEQFLDRVLGRLGLQLLGSTDPRHQGDVHEHRAFPAELLAHLPDGFEKGQGLNVTDGAADFDDGYVGVRSHLAHGGFDFVGDVGDDLHRLSQVISTALFRNNLFVDAPRGPIVIAGKFGVGEAFVVAEIEIGFGAIVGDENFAVLKGRHGARIDVEIRIELHQVNFEAMAFQQAANRGRRQSLAQ